MDGSDSGREVLDRRLADCRYGMFSRREWSRRRGAVLCKVGSGLPGFCPPRRLARHLPVCRQTIFLRLETFQRETGLLHHRFAALGDRRPSAAASWGAPQNTARRHTGWIVSTLKKYVALLLGSTVINDVSIYHLVHAFLYVII